MLRLYLVRHATAEPAPEDAGFADPVRPLTPKGRKRFRKIARAFAALDEEVDLVCTSPALRAVQTAELLAHALGGDRVEVLDALRPGSAAEALLPPLRTLEACSVALVGHHRQLVDLAAQLGALPLADAARLRLRHGAIVRIDVRRLGGAPAGRPRWWIGPDRTRQDGLPFDPG